MGRLRSSSESETPAVALVGFPAGGDRGAPGDCGEFDCAGPRVGCVDGRWVGDAALDQRCRCDARCRRHAVLHAVRLSSLPAVRRSNRARGEPVTDPGVPAQPVPAHRARVLVHLALRLARARVGARAVRCAPRERQAR